MSEAIARALANTALEGWNVIESKVVNEWIAMGEARGRTEGEARGEARGRTEGEAKGRNMQAATMLISVLEARFGRIPLDLESTLHATSDLGTLEAWVLPAVTVATLADFRRASGM